MESHLELGIVDDLTPQLHDLLRMIEAYQTLGLERKSLSKFAAHPGLADVFAYAEDRYLTDDDVNWEICREAGKAVEKISHTRAIGRSLKNFQHCFSCGRFGATIRAN